MNFLQFEYVLAIQRAGTIRGAAEALCLSPQALSEHLGKLERELGAPLFHRTKPLTLTEAGERFIDCAETCLDARQRLETALTAITQRHEQHIFLGVPTGMSPPLLLPFLDYFRYIRPEVSVHVVELPTRTGCFQEIPHHIDMVLGEFQGESSRLIYTPILRSNRFVVAVHRDLLRQAVGTTCAASIEAAAHRAEPVPLTAFQRCPFVLKRSGSIIRENENRIFRAAGFSPEGAVETGDMELTVRLVLLGRAAVYFPKPVADANFMFPDTLAEDRVLLCPVLAPDGEEWQLSAGMHRYRRVPGSAHDLIEAAKTYYTGVLGEAQKTPAAAL